MNHSDHQSEKLPDRLKEISADLKQQFTHVEQEPPNKPSFLLVVLLSGVAIIIIFILAIVVLHLGHGRIEHPFRGHPTSQLVLPSIPASPRTALG